MIVSARLIDGGDLRLRVHDNGVGMTEDEIAAAMQPFHQLDTAPRKQTGTGLGLPVTKALADANRARLLHREPTRRRHLRRCDLPQGPARALSRNAAGARMTFLASANTPFLTISIAIVS